MEISLLENIRLSEMSFETPQVLDPEEHCFKIRIPPMRNFRLIEGNGKPEAEVFFESLKRTANDYEIFNSWNHPICIHLNNSVADPQEIYVRIHGLPIRDPGYDHLLIKDFKFRFQLSLSILKHLKPDDGTFIDETAIIDTVLSLDDRKEMPIHSGDPSEPDFLCIKEQKFCEARITSSSKTLFESLHRITKSHIDFRYENEDYYFVQPPGESVMGCVSLTLFRDSGESDLDPSALLNKKILNDVESDMAIVAGNGAVVPCHKNFLAVHSYFRVMFASKMKETINKRIEMPEMSEDSVRAFLEYLYTCDLSKPKEVPRVALELLEAGHKYHIDELERKMQELFLTQPSTWVDVDVALDLFQFARNVDKLASLKRKAVEVIKTKPQEMKESDQFKNFFIEKPAVAMALCASIVSL